MLLTAFLSELLGTALMVLLGTGVSANNTLRASAGHRGGSWLLISFGWGIAVFIGVEVAYKSGAYLNPAVTLGAVVSGAATLAPHVPATAPLVLAYFAAQFIGAFLGAVAMWLVYKQQLDAETDPERILGVFATRPMIRHRGWNLVTEGGATFVLVLVVLAFDRHTDVSGFAGIGGLPALFLITGLVASLGGPTGAALNPVRDLAPRIAHAILPITHKGPSEWSYSWVPILGPLAGGVLAGLVAPLVLP